MITNQPSEIPKAEPGHKLFFALWPDDATRSALARLQSLVPGRPVPADKLHLTLAFLGRQPAAALAPLRAMLERLALPALRLDIDCLGYFSRPQIAWAGMRQPPDALMAMQAALMAELEAAGFSAATHGRFRPHVTLARDARTAPPDAAFAPLAWRVAEVALVASSSDSGLYAPLATRRA